MVLERAGGVLLGLAQRERAGELYIVAWREALDGPLLRRADLSRGGSQLPLPLPIPKP